MENIEYKVIRIEVGSDPSAEIENLLNKYSVDGWIYEDLKPSTKWFSTLIIFKRIATCGHH